MIDIEKLITDQLEHIDLETIVAKEIRKALQGDIQREINRLMSTKVGQVIDSEITIAMSQPIETDNGFGKRNTYGSFEDLFKQQLHERLNTNYEMKRNIERMVKSHTEALFKAKADKINQYIVEQLTDEEEK